jgi:hypothetical protein
MILSEELIYYVWSNKTFGHNNLKTTVGETVEIVSYGTRNYSSGPDFLNGKVKINGILWAGNIEMHVRSSDWVKHKHDNDPAYKNVILHVVYDEDKVINELPVLVMKDIIYENILQQHDKLMESTDWIPCEKIISTANLEKFSIWSHGITIERLVGKMGKLQSSQAYQSKDWHQLMYQQIAKYFGASENMEVFESITEKLPYNLILKNKHDAKIIESLVFGVAGFLNNEIDDPYFIGLKREYDFQKTKYSLSENKLVEWRNFGMYASGSPTYRLAQFAAFIFHTKNIFDLCINVVDIKVLKKMLDVEVNAYWTSHFAFGKETSAIKSSNLSSDFKERIIINAIIPVLFSYAKETDNDDLAVQTIDLLSSLKVEKNSILDKWKSLGLKATSALESQALIHLKTRYCDLKKCLSCPIGRELIK